MVEVFVLPAGAGDCILIRFGSENSKRNNILVDGGVNCNKESIKKLINLINSKGEKLDIIITHVDSDHISGILGGFNLCNEDVLNNCIRYIYLNTINGINRHSNNNVQDDPLNEIKLNISNSGGYSISEAVSLLEIIGLKGLSDRLVDYVIAGQVIELDSATLRIISPSINELNRLATRWEQEKPNVNIEIAGYSPYYPSEIDSDLSVLMEEPLPSPDTSIYNKSSIAFVFEYDDIKLLMLGDASSDTCLRSIKEISLLKPFRADAVKLSHHGSSKNISDDFLDYVVTDTFVLSTNGRLITGRAEMPGKHTISRLIKKKHFNYVVVLNNYNWWDDCYKGNYFTKNDFHEYINSKILRLITPKQDGHMVKEGLIVYGNWRQLFEI